LTHQKLLTEDDHGYYWDTQQWRAQDVILEGTNLTRIIHLPGWELVALAVLSISGTIIGANPCTTLWGVHGTGEVQRAEERRSKAREDGKFPYPPARGFGECCKLPTVGCGAKLRSPQRFRTFYGLTKPLLEWIYIYFSEVFGGPSHRRPPQPNYLGGSAPQDPHVIGAYGYNGWQFWVYKSLYTLLGTPLIHSPTQHGTCYKTSPTDDVRKTLSTYIGVAGGQ